VTTAGVAAVRQDVKPEKALGVLEACDLAIDHSFYIAAEDSVCAFKFLLEDGLA
jgi:hypothetical protein